MMPNRSEVAENILNQMLKGPSSNFPKRLTSEQREAFYNKFGEVAAEIALVLPQTSSGTYSGAIGAVICKCAIKYGTKKALDLIHSVKDCIFKGKNDPARLLWTFMISGGTKGLNAEQIYRKTVTAVRAYCENRDLMDLRYASKDIFEWDSDFNAEDEKPWWEKLKPEYGKKGSFAVFKRHNDDKWEYAIFRKYEILLLRDGKIEVLKKSPTKSTRSEEHTSELQ